MNEWKTVMGMCMLEYHSALKKDILSFVTWMKLKNITPNEINQTQEEKYSIT